MKQFTGFMRGVNLGGWLSQGSYDSEHLNTFITEDDIKTIAGWGLDHVRMPVDYNVFENEKGEQRDDGIELVQKAVDWCGKYGLNMVLDLHKTYGYSFEKAYGEKGFFESETLQERFYKLWERLAARFGKYSDRVAFELLNEVHDPSVSDTWNSIIRTAMGRIRAIAPDTYILVGGYWNNSIDALKDLEMPYDDKTVYNFHCYDPFLFTHQAAFWVDNMPADLRISYPGDIQNYRSTMKKIGLDGMQDYMDVEKFGPEYFESRWHNAVKLCEERGVALYCGEYGVIDRSAPEDALSWFKDIHTVFEKYSIGRAAWSYKAMDFGISDKRMDSVRDELIKNL